MTTINLKSFKGKNFNDVYVFIMLKQEFGFKLVIPRQDNTEPPLDYMTVVDFVCAGYAAFLLQQVATDFSYTVPSAHKNQPFEFYVETTEPEKFIDVVYTLLVAYNARFMDEQCNRFYYRAANHYTETLRINNPLTVAGIGLLAVSDQQLASSNKAKNI